MIHKAIWMLTVLAAVALLQACFTNGESFDTTQSKSHDPVKGSYIYGHEVNSFQPCGTTAELWVIGDRALLTKLENDYRKLASKPYQQIFVSFHGKKLGKGSDGFAADYSGRFEVTKVETVQKDNICN